MNSSYDDPSSGYPSGGRGSSSGRARVPGPAAGYGDGYDGGYDSRSRDGYERDSYDRDDYRGSQNARDYGRGRDYDDYSDDRYSTASAASGRATVSGSARVPSGRASVRPAGGYDDDDYGFGGSAATGRASVGTAPVSPAAGRASVGRARVGTPDEIDLDLDRPVSRRGRGPGGGGRGPTGPDGDAGDGPPPKKRHRKRTWILSAVAVFIMLSGLAVVIGAYQFNGIPDPQAFTPPQSTTIYYSDGTTPMAKLGDQNRTLVTLAQVSQWVPWAVVATEDMTFYSNSGVSFRGIARAAWNNVRGGSTQGGSTISQQYMKQALSSDPSQRTYKVKIQEALGAIKLDEKFSKDQIMEMYLNVIYFGRGAYGIEAASQAYFNKPAKDLTLEESMVLADVIKDPGGAFDPTQHLDA
ncbi:MAG TPA: biosynthetic peptidoglycan transglycosylase, partial [Rugosimonospora sp.]|nr:biosynthetic peptidoglycan transglycosylase [Rugosimonospora sp.]